MRLILVWKHLKSMLIILFKESETCKTCFLHSLRAFEAETFCGYSDISNVIRAQYKKITTGFLHTYLRFFEKFWPFQHDMSAILMVVGNFWKSTKFAPDLGCIGFRGQVSKIQNQDQVGTS